MQKEEKILKIVSLVLVIIILMFIAVQTFFGAFNAVKRSIPCRESAYELTRPYRKNYGDCKYSSDLDVQVMPYYYNQDTSETINLPVYDINNVPQVDYLD